MKKNLLVVLLIGLLLTGCGKVGYKTSNTNNDLVEVQSIQRLLSASDVVNTESYDFAISNEVVDGIDTFKLTDKLVITADNDLEYILFYSKDGDFENSSEELFERKYETIPKNGYYRIESDGNLDINISTM